MDLAEKLAHLTEKDKKNRGSCLAVYTRWLISLGFGLLILWSNPTVISLDEHDFGLLGNKSVTLQIANWLVHL